MSSYKPIVTKQVLRKSLLINILMPLICLIIIILGGVLILNTFSNSLFEKFIGIAGAISIIFLCRGIIITGHLFILQLKSQQEFGITFATLIKSNFQITSAVSDSENRKAKRAYISSLFPSLILLPALVSLIFFLISYVYVLSHPEFKNSTPPFLDTTAYILLTLWWLSAGAGFFFIIIFLIKIITSPRINKRSKANKIRQSTVPIKWYTKIKKNIFYTISTILIILIITNPSAKRFKEFLGENSYSGLRREQNWVIFSFYNDGYNRYVGVFLNFIKLKEVND